MNAFEKDTIHRLLTEAVRVWVVSNYLETRAIPQRDAIFYVYPSGEVSIDWGDSRYRKDGDPAEPMARKRVKITLTIEAQAELANR